jgi:hypothetical protein
MRPCAGGGRPRPTNTDSRYQSLNLGSYRTSLRAIWVLATVTAGFRTRVLAEGRHTPPIKYFVMQNHQLIHRRLSCGNPPISSRPRI